MTIRFTLLTSYLLISLTSGLLISVLVFAHFRDILLQEINGKLQSQANSIMQQIDIGLFERFEDMAMWGKLEVMQEIHVGDVDKRLENFIYELHTGYGGIYKRIFVVNQQDKVIASTDVQMIGKIYPLQQAWLTVTHKNNNYSLYPLDVLRQELLFSIPIPDAYKTAVLGRLYVGFDWRENSRLLDAPMPLTAQNAPIYALLMDATGNIIATSSQLHGKDIRFSPANGSSAVANDSGLIANPIGFFNGEDVLVGDAKAQGYRSFLGIGWRVLILQPSDSALRPIWQLWMEMLAYYLLVSLLGVLVSLWMSGRIAKPIVQLAAFIRDFMRGNTSFPLEFQSSKEINELNSQFILMIDHLEQSRRDVERVAKLAVIGEMAASMAHEVRTPLGILRTSAQILERESNLSDIGAEMISYILSETHRLNDLVSTLLACAKPRQPYFSCHDLHNIVTHTLELLQNQADTRHIQFTARLDANPSLLDGDRDQLIQVLLNLAINAIQHVNNGGHVEVTTSNQGESLQVCVNDDGPGITDEDKSKVFEPFFTRRQEGIGLGLTVVQQIVNTHHGRVYIADSPWGGASFKIILPVVQKDYKDD